MKKNKNYRSKSKSKSFKRNKSKSFKRNKSKSKSFKRSKFKSLRRNKSLYGGSSSLSNLFSRLSTVTKPSVKLNQQFKGPSPGCCPLGSIQVKFLRVHGYTPYTYRNLDTFKIPENTNIITLTHPGDNLNIHSAIKDEIFELYKQKKSLFKKNDTSTELSDEGFRIMERFNEKQSEESPKLFFRNHIPGMIMNNLSFNFNSDGCVKGSMNSSCALFCLNKKTNEESECLPKYMNRDTGELNIYKGSLEEITHIEGHGTYILNICRGTSANDNTKQAMRALSGV